MGFRHLHSERGSALMIVLVMVVILGLCSGWCGMTLKSIRQREKEEELLWRGTQYRRAIERFVKLRQPATQPGQPQPPRNQAAAAANYPRTLEDLIKDPNQTTTVRHLRKLFKDPMTGEDFVVIVAPGGGVKGVRSASKDKPMKADNFSKEYEPFKDAESYAKWEFVYEPGSDVSQSTTGAGSVDGAVDILDGGFGGGSSGRSGGSGSGAGGSGRGPKPPSWGGAPYGDLPDWMKQQQKPSR